jgi:hypothetical protein
MKKELTLCLPSGIGDVSWVLSKIVNVKDDYTFHIQVADGWPYRTIPFLKLFPWIESVEYGDFAYGDILAFSTCHDLSTWKNISECGFGRILISPNLHLEQGKRLEEWLPDIPTDFHYHIPTSKEDYESALAILMGWHKIYNVYGISAASYRGSEAWSTWGFKEWSDFIKLWQSVEPEARFILMGGFWDDLTFALYESFGSNCINAVGKTFIGAAVEIHRKLKGYVGFSSGLGIIRTVLGLKTFMLWPDHQVELSTSWAPPEMLSSGTYMASLWRSPEEVMNRFKQWLKL